MPSVHPAFGLNEARASLDAGGMAGSKGLMKRFLSLSFLCDRAHKSYTSSLAVVWKYLSFIFSSLCSPYESHPLVPPSAKI